MTADAGKGGDMSVNLRELLEEMIKREASDLHITAGERPKIRVDGEITNSHVEHVLTPKETLQIAYSVLTTSPSAFRTSPGSAATASSSVAACPS
jgi:Tfp pilus assembly pilus retraction ATPase PilT